MDVRYRLVNVFKKDAHSYHSMGPGNYRDDINNCLALARQSDAYGTKLDRYLPDLWEQLLIEKRMSLAMIEETETEVNSEGESSHRTRPIGFCSSCFVRGKFYREVIHQASAEKLRPPVCAYLYDQHQRANLRNDKSPILTRREVAQANACEGHDGLYACYFIFQEDPILDTPQGIHAFAITCDAAITAMFKGYWLEGVINEPFSLPARMQTPTLGFQVKDYDKHYTQAENSHIAEKHRLFLAYVDRATLVPGSRLYNGTTLLRPALNLTLEQREMLEFIWQGATDSMLAQHYDTSEKAILSRRSVIYAKICAANSNLLTNGDERAKRANLLTYLHNHPEEFRPYPTKRSVSRDLQGKFRNAVQAKEDRHLRQDEELISQDLSALVPKLSPGKIHQENQHVEKAETAQ